MDDLLMIKSRISSAPPSGSLLDGQWIRFMLTIAIPDRPTRRGNDYDITHDTKDDVLGCSALKRLIVSQCEEFSWPKRGSSSGH
jgi:hypothetical protein